MDKSWGPHQSSEGSKKSFHFLNNWHVHIHLQVDDNINFTWFSIWEVCQQLFFYVWAFEKCKLGIGKSEAEMEKKEKWDLKYLDKPKVQLFKQESKFCQPKKGKISKDQIINLNKEGKLG